MLVPELVVWSGMAGVLSLLGLIAAADWAMQRTMASARGLAFVGLTGGAALLMSGLPEQLWPALESPVLLPLKASLGPLSGALALTYLGAWLGLSRDDMATRWAVRVGSGLLVVFAVLLAFAATHDMGLKPRQVLLISCLVNLGSVAVAMFVSLRGALLGDELAHWMAIACVLLGVMVLGLYAKGLNIAGLGTPAWAITAMATVGYFLIVIVLTIQRNREVRRLRQLAAGLNAQHVNIPLPQGSLLIPRVADVMWRSQRLERPCVVAALVVRNLYELGETAEDGVEAQILAVLAARIRRHVGFRNLVGLYHPRCFVLAVSSGQDPRRGELLVETLLQSVRERVRVGSCDQHFDFWPSVGLGLVDVTHSPMDALTTINRAEQLAVEDDVRVHPQAWHWPEESAPQPL